MLKNFDQFTINEQTIIPTIGRNPNDFEWQVLRHFYYSCYLNKPIPGINDIIDHGHNYLTVNEAMQLAVGLESKGSITSSSALRPCAALGTKPALKYQSKQSKISFGVVKNDVNQLSKISGHEELFFLHDSKTLGATCADLLHLKAIIIKYINPSSLGYMLNTISDQKYGFDIQLSSAAQVSIFSDKKIHGALIAIDKQFSSKVKSICKIHKQSCLHLGSLKQVQFLSIAVRKKRKTHLPLTIFNIPDLPKPSIVPVISGSLKKDKLKRVKELKNYSNHVLEMWKIIKKQKFEMFKPQKHVLGSYSLVPGKNEFAVSFPDNMHLLDKNIKVGSRIAISNAARQLICNGYKPMGTAYILHGGNMQENDHLWFLQEIYMGISEACQLIGMEMLRPVITSNNKNHPSLELCVVGKRFGKETSVRESFVSENDFITMLGSHRGELNSSQYQEKIQKQESNTIPAVDLPMETRLQETVLQGIQSGLIKSAVNVSNGGLAVSLVKSLQNAEKGMGARIHLSRKLRQDEMLFGETQGMVVVSIGERDLMEFERICMTIGIPSTTIGRVTNDNRFKFNDVVNIDRKKL